MTLAPTSAFDVLAVTAIVAPVAMGLGVIAGMRGGVLDGGTAGAIERSCGPGSAPCRWSSTRRWRRGEVAPRVAGHACVMDRGRIAFEGRGEAVRDDPRPPRHLAP